MPTAIVLHNDVRIGVQIIVEGEKLDLTRLLTLLNLFLELVVPVMMTVRTATILIGRARVRSVHALDPIRIRKEVSIIGYGILLAVLLIGVIINEIST